MKTEEFSFYVVLINFIFIPNERVVLKKQNKIGNNKYNRIYLITK